MPFTTDSQAPHRDPVAYCSQQVRRGDEDFFLSVGYAPAADRPRLLALFALQIELRRIPHAVSEPPLGEIRLQWWRDALDEVVSGGRVRAHPVVEALHASGAVTQNNRDLAERMIEGRARLLYEPQFQSFDDFENFVKDAEAPMAALTIGDAGAMLHREATGLGAAYALARLAPILAAEIAFEASAVAQRRIDDLSPSLNCLPPSTSGCVAFLALARGYAARPDGRPWPIAKRVMLFRAMLSGRF